MFVDADCNRIWCVIEMLIDTGDLTGKVRFGQSRRKLMELEVNSYFHCLAASSFITCLKLRLSTVSTQLISAVVLHHIIISYDLFNFILIMTMMIKNDISTGGKVQGKLFTPNADQPFLHG